ncbi:MAG: hypothetical protein PUC11_06655 [Elusimicrobia bacterium]|nr:hypothetical protein [Elusimicrobiota bacterium]
MFEIGQKLTKENYTAAAVWCNANNAHIEKQNGAYIIMGNAPAPELTYAEKRAAEYPSMAEQLDMMYWDRVNGTHVWEETVAAVKAKYPKPSEVVIPGESISDNLSDVSDVKQTEEQE